ncbi:MAG: nucleotidyltransferase domain-containing protein [Polyangiales bacterium]
MPDIEPVVDPRSALRPLVARLREALGAEEVWLFGSRARGTATLDSDWDLLVVVPDGVSEEVVDPVSVWRLRRASALPTELLVCRRSDFDEDRETPNTLAFEAWHAGVRVDER